MDVLRVKIANPSTQAFSWNLRASPTSKELPPVKAKGKGGVPSGPKALAKRRADISAVYAVPAAPPPIRQAESFSTETSAKKLNSSSSSTKKERGSIMASPSSQIHAQPSLNLSQSIRSASDSAKIDTAQSMSVIPVAGKEERVYTPETENVARALSFPDPSALLRGVSRSRQEEISDFEASVSKILDVEDIKTEGFSEPSLTVAELEVMREKAREKVRQEIEEREKEWRALRLVGAIRQFVEAEEKIRSEIAHNEYKVRVELEELLHHRISDSLIRLQQQLNEKLHQQRIAERSELLKEQSMLSMQLVLNDLQSQEMDARGKLKMEASTWCLSMQHYMAAGVAVVAEKEAAIIDEERTRERLEAWWNASLRAAILSYASVVNETEERCLIIEDWLDGLDKLQELEQRNRALAWLANFDRIAVLGSEERRARHNIRMEEFRGHLLLVEYLSLKTLEVSERCDLKQSERYAREDLKKQEQLHKLKSRREERSYNRRKTTSLVKLRVHAAVAIQRAWREFRKNHVKRKRTAGSRVPATPMNSTLPMHPYPYQGVMMPSMHHPVLQMGDVTFVPMMNPAYFQMRAPSPIRPYSGPEGDEAIYQAGRLSTVSAKRDVLAATAMAMGPLHPPPIPSPIMPYPDSDASSGPHGRKGA